MEKEELIQHLQEVLSLFVMLEAADAECRRRQQDIDSAASMSSSRLRDFDNATKPQYIKSIAGEKPKRPMYESLFALAKYIKEMREYKEELSKYENVLLPAAEESYLTHFSEQREALKAEERQAKAVAMAEKQRLFNVANDHKKELAAKLQAIEWVSGELKSKEAVNLMIDYLATGRADTYKEAANLFFNEKRKDEEEARNEAHRQELRMLEEKRLQEAREFQNELMKVEKEILNKEKEILEAQEDLEDDITESKLEAYEDLLDGWKALRNYAKQLKDKSSDL